MMARRIACAVFAAVVGCFANILPTSAQEIIVRADRGSTVHAALESRSAGVAVAVALPWQNVTDVSPVAPRTLPAQDRADRPEAFVVALGDSVSLAAALADWRAVPGVRYVQENRRYTIDSPRPANGPSDPLADSLRYRQVINADAAWAVTRGSPEVRVGFVDTGVHFEHADLEGAFWVNAGEDANGNGRFDAADLNGIDDDGNGIVDDIRGYDFVDRPQSVEPADYRTRDPDPSDDGSGHGTTIAGVLGARADNGVGIAGVAPLVQLVPLRAFGADGRGDDDDVAAAIIYGADLRLDVINLSFGDSYYSPLMHEAIRYAVNRGSIVVASAGNVGGDDPHYPSDYPEVISTVWLTEDGLFPAARASYGVGVDIGAPGTSVFTTIQPTDSSPAEYGRMSGSSLASPMVSGVAALLRSVDPGIGVAGVRAALLGTATDVGDAGWDHRTGAGLLNAGAAVFRVLPARVEIQSPQNDGGAASDTVPIVGTVIDPAFVHFEVSVAAGFESLRAQDFLPIGDRGTNQTVSDTLAVWQAAGYSDGPYTIRLAATLASGATIEDRRRVYLDRTAPVVVSMEVYPAFDAGASALFVDLQSDDLVGAELVVEGMPAGPGTIASDRRARRHGLVVRADAAGGTANTATIVVTNTSGLTTTVPVMLDFPDARPNASLFDRISLPLAHGFPLPALVDFDGDGLKELVYNIYKEGQLGDTLTIAEYPGWHGEPFLVSNVFPRDAGDTDRDGRAELLGQVGGATVLFEAVEQDGPPNTVTFVDTVGLGSPSSPVAVWGARLADADGDGVGEILAHNTRAVRVLERAGDTFVEVAVLENPTTFDNSELSANEIAQPELLVGDFDDDGAVDVLFGDADGDLVLFEATGNDAYALRWTHETNQYGAGRYFASGRLADGTMWFAVTTTNWIGQRSDREYEPDVTFVRIFINAGPDEYELAHAFALPGEIDGHSGLASIDADGDGSDDLVVLAAPDVYIVGLAGSRFELLYHTRSTVEAPGSGYRSARVVSDDVDGDGRDDLLIATLTGYFEWWNPRSPVPTAPPTWVRAHARDAASVYLEWISPGADSTTIYAGPAGSSLNVVATTSGSSVVLPAGEARGYALRSWADGLSSALSDARSVRPHAAARLVSIEYPSARQARLVFSSGLDGSAGEVLSTPATSGQTRHVVDRNAIIVGFDRPIADSISWSGLRDDEGMPIPDSTVWIDTRSIPVADFIVASWELIPPSRVAIRFSDDLDQATATDPANYAVEPAGSVVRVRSGADASTSVEVEISGAAVGMTGAAARLRVVGVRSADGRTIAEEGGTISLSVAAAGLEDAYVYPNPVAPDHNRLTIAGLPRLARVEVFSSGGSTVRSLVETDGNGGVDWDLRDERGALVPSGVYLFRVTHDDRAVLLKAAIVR